MRASVRAFAFFFFWSPITRRDDSTRALGVMAKSLRTGVGSILGLTRGEGGFLKLELELELRHHQPAPALGVYGVIPANGRRKYPRSRPG